MVAPVAIPVLVSAISTALTEIPKLTKALEATAQAATAKARGFDDFGVKGAAATAAPAGPDTAKATAAMQQLGTGFKKVLSDVEQAGGAPDAQQARAIIDSAFGSAENLNGLIQTATQQTAKANAAMEAGTGSAAHQNSKTGTAFGEVLRVLGPIADQVSALIQSGKATGQAVGARASS